MAEENKQRKRSYHVMIFTDAKGGGVSQMGIDRRVIQVLGILILAVVLISCIGWSVNSRQKKELTEEKTRLQAEVDAITEELATVTAANTELTNKVTILSDTVNTKVEEQNAIKQESDAAHMPEGFPLSSSASMTSDEEDPNTVIFTCNEGTSVIASGAGTVTEVIPDTDYGNCIKIDHMNGYVTEYYMSGTPLIRENDEVLQGAILGLVEGNKAKIAYKVFQDGKQINPMDIIKIDG